MNQATSLTPAQRSLLLDAAIILCVFLLALALRLPYLQDVPRYTDETDEIDLALRIARGEIFPMTNVVGYLGAFYNYLLAGAFLRRY